MELLRVLQEALANVRQHSDARNVEVMLAGQGSEIQAAVRDDGRAWDSRRWESRQPRSAENWWSKANQEEGPR